jgi:AbiV family abortive infection protein
MSSLVTAGFLLQGTVYALEQYGLLLRDSNLLYRGGSYASAIVLAAFAREELGRSSILLDLRRKVLSGEKFSLDDIQDQCDDHVTKQKAGMLSLVFTADRDSGLGKLLRARMENHPQTAEWKEADAALKQIQEAKKKRIPSDRHRSRTSALYVEPISEYRWNRPGDTSAELAREFLQDAANDYAGRYQQGYITGDDPILKHIDAELYSALERWPDRPNLPAPEWPALLHW